MQETQKTKDSELLNTEDHNYGQLSQVQAMNGPRTSTQIPRQVTNVPDKEDDVKINQLRAEPHQQTIYPRKIHCIKCYKSVRVETADSLCNYCGKHPLYM
jgi:hypothetical protein